ncbi:MAG: hypothetical protein LQ338_002300 [Usnochroma carphineum]|nr:MAG: hypothetical protein LQ338_002300 [Usnochroma carphineum]
MDPIPPALPEDLHSACLNDDLPTLSALLSQRRTANPTYSPPFPSIFYTATRHDRLTIAQYCIDNKTPITPEVMKIALINRSKAVYTYLLDSESVDVDYYIPWFGDILSNVALRNDLEWARLCLSHGADPNKNLVDEHKSVLAAVAESEEGSVEMAELLTEYGARVKGSGAIVMAAEVGNMDMVRFLMEKGADVNEMGIEHPTDPRYEEDVGTALHRAVVGGHRDIVKLLLEKGADTGLTDLMGRTPLDLAREKADEGISDMLQVRR